MKSDDDNTLWKEIQLFRKIMHGKILEYEENIGHPDIIELSQQLDGLLNKYTSLLIHNK